MTSTLKLDKADGELVTDSGSADEGDSVSGSELARKKNPHTSCSETSAARLLALFEGCQQKPLFRLQIAEQSTKIAPRSTCFCMNHLCSLL